MKSSRLEVIVHFNLCPVPFQGLRAADLPAETSHGRVEGTGGTHVPGKYHQGANPVSTPSTVTSLCTNGCGRNLEILTGKKKSPQGCGSMFWSSQQCFFFIFFYFFFPKGDSAFAGSESVRLTPAAAHHPHHQMSSQWYCYKFFFLKRAK